MVDIVDYFRRSASALNTAAVDKALHEIVVTAAKDCVSALKIGAPILVCGNGGSAADAMHIVGELVGRFRRERRALNVIALTANAAVITAWANDYEYDTIFSRQVEAHGQPNGVLIALSTSGNSRNVVLAAEAAKQAKMKVIAMTGEGGGALGKLADHTIMAPSRDTPIIQQIHQVFYHLLCDIVEYNFSVGASLTPNSASY